MTTLFDPLKLPNGAVIPNRIAKAAMEENMANNDHAPSEQLLRLYRAWAEGGAGLILTGNVMIDRRALTGPGGVVLEDSAQLPLFEQWATAARHAGNQVWMQINHPGRQVMAAMGQETVAPSAVPVRIPGLEKMFLVPRALTGEEIETIISRFVTTAQLAERAGFTGVQIHAAHGYLLSQFLSPLTNQRTDQWGGSLQNRARFLIHVIKAVRTKVAPNFCVSVKLNSADFQRGGFDAADAIHVIEMLNTLSVDMVEISGGSYESPAMRGFTADGRTLAREAHFLSFAEDIRKVATMPVMLTGGISKPSVAERALERGIDMVGMATALAMEPSLPNQWRQSRKTEVRAIVLPWKNKALAATATSAIVKLQLDRVSHGKKTNPKTSAIWALIRSQIKTRQMTKRYRAWIASEADTAGPKSGS